MRKVQLGNPPNDDKGKLDWIINALKEIERASFDDPVEYFDEFVPSNVTVTRTFDADTATVAILSDVVGTLINDMKDRLT